MLKRYQPILFEHMQILEDLFVYIRQLCESTYSSMNFNQSTVNTGQVFPQPEDIDQQKSTGPAYAVKIFERF